MGLSFGEGRERNRWTLGVLDTCMVNSRFFTHHFGSSSSLPPTLIMHHMFCSRAAEAVRDSRLLGRNETKTGDVQHDYVLKGTTTKLTITREYLLPTSAHLAHRLAVLRAQR